MADQSGWICVSVSYATASCESDPKRVNYLCRSMNGQVCCLSGSGGSVTVLCAIDLKRVNSLCRGVIGQICYVSGCCATAVCVNGPQKVNDLFRCVSGTTFVIGSDATVVCGRDQQKVSGEATTCVCDGCVLSEMKRVSGMTNGESKM